MLAVCLLIVKHYEQGISNSIAWFLLLALAILVQLLFPKQMVSEGSIVFTRALTFI